MKKNCRRRSPPHFPCCFLSKWCAAFALAGAKGAPAASRSREQGGLDERGAWPSEDLPSSSHC
eukprot:9268977-Pyramimonas_sp.AAC.1